MTVVVYKVGGSLLSLPDLGSRLRCLLSGQPFVRPLLIVGGGPAADLVRDWDRLHSLGEEHAHWLALWSMTLSERLLLGLLPEGCLVENRQTAAAAWEAGRWPVLSAYPFIRDEEAASDVRLPHTWDVTSDSIAAWVAIRWPAGELVLLKSTDLPRSLRVDSNLAVPYVDPFFHQLALHVPRIRWVNLRDDGEGEGGRRKAEG